MRFLSDTTTPPSGPAALILLAAAAFMVAALAWSRSGIFNFADLASPGRCDWGADSLSPACRSASLNALVKVSSLLTLAAGSAGGFSFVGNVPAATSVKLFGKGWGGHALVENVSTGRPPGSAGPCIFYSYGISIDYSFDEELARDWGCHGFLFDPSIVYPASMAHGMRFFYLAAPLLDSDHQRPCLEARKCALPAEASPPRVMALFGHSWISVLKMDCEGCEFALARDVAAADPTFFSRVGQFAVEVHVPRTFLKGGMELHFLGLLYHMLSAHGFELVQAKVKMCGRKHEETGCLPELVALGYPCGIGRGCHNYLFARLH